jgi:hypothetical protein
MYGEGLLMMSAWRSKHVELYTYRQKIKIYHKLHLLVYLLEPFLDSVKHACYEKDKHKADVNIFKYFQVPKRKFYTKIRQRMMAFSILGTQTHRGEGVTCERCWPLSSACSSSSPKFRLFRWLFFYGANLNLTAITPIQHLIYEKRSEMHWYSKTKIHFVRN